MYPAPIISQLSFEWCHGIRGLCTNNDIYFTFWANFDDCNGLWPSWEPRRLRSRFIGIWKVRIQPFYIIFKLNRVFSALLLHHSPLKELAFHHVLWKQRLKSNQNIPNHCTSWTSGNFSRAWIVSPIKFHIAKLDRFITCHFLVNNSHLITYSNRIVLPTEKKIRTELNAANGNFSTQFSRVLTFSTNKIGF